MLDATPSSLVSCFKGWTTLARCPRLDVFPPTHLTPRTLAAKVVRPRASRIPRRKPKQRSSRSRPSRPVWRDPPHMVCNVFIYRPDVQGADLELTVLGDAAAFKTNWVNAATAAAGLSTRLCIALLSCQYFTPTFMYEHPSPSSHAHISDLRLQDLESQGQLIGQLEKASAGVETGRKEMQALGKTPSPEDMQMVLQRVTCLLHAWHFHFLFNLFSVYLLSPSEATPFVEAFKKHSRTASNLYPGPKYMQPIFIFIHL